MSQSLSQLDVATGTMLGCSAQVEPLPDLGLRPREALERAILPALLRPPCLVSFSGGRDSSAVLATAVDLARREGLDAPIPATNRFPEADGADETSWQAAVVTHLGLDEWFRVEHRDELDLLGPYARRIMRRHGLLLPFNVHFHLPLLDAAAGGALVTGVGGDELFTAARQTHPALDAAVGSPARRLLSGTLHRARAVARRGRRRGREPGGLLWLRPEARRAFLDHVTSIAAQEPRSLPQRLAWWRALRYMDDGRAGLRLAADDANVTLVHPLLERQLWASVGRTANPTKFTDRSHGMVSLFGDLLPRSILTRQTKAQFDGAMWTGTARCFAQRWDGRGVPSECVDADALREHWLTGPSGQSFTLLQAAWLASAENRAEESLDGLLV
jgi:asparagine synthase (glutamine-hydrolysing)